MPEKPRKGESRESFMSRCYSYFSKNEKGTSREKIGAVCNSMWERRGKKK